jgi:hypothetical protein
MAFQGRLFGCLIALGLLATGCSRNPSSMAGPNPSGDIAIGYNYTSTAKMKTVMIPKPLPGGQSKFDLVVGDKTYTVEAGKRFFFRIDSPDGVDAFTIRGINPSEGLDANNMGAFPTGISFMQEGVTPDVKMFPIVKKPSLLTSGWVLGSLAALALGGVFFAGFVWWRRNNEAE